MADQRKPQPYDVMFFLGRSEDGKSVNGVRLRPDGVHLAEIRPAEEGKTVSGELIRLQERSDLKGLYDVETIYRGPDASHASSGPPQVATEAYRRHWEAIFARHTESDEERDPKDLN